MSVSNRLLKYLRLKPTELKGETDKLTIIPGDFNTLLSVIDGINKQNIRKDIKDSNNHSNQFDIHRRETHQR